MMVRSGRFHPDSDRANTCLGRPIIWTSINYRLHHFGFSASREMAEAGVLNLGLEDQRVAMRWIQQNIASVGHDCMRKYTTRLIG